MIRDLLDCLADIRAIPPHEWAEIVLQLAVLFATVAAIGMLAMCFAPEVAP